MMFSLEVIILDYFFKPHWLFPNQENKKTPWVTQGVFEMTSSLLSSVH